jgi:peptidoglycan/LPS O-acetylase OafA/YrhL
MSLSQVDPHLGTLDASQFPRTYQSSLGYRLAFVSLGLLLAAASLLGVWYFATGRGTTAPPATIFLTLLCFCFFLLGAYLALAMLKGKVILTADAIELRDPFVTRQLLRSQIAGWRLIPTQYVSGLEFVPRDPHGKKIKFALTIKLDEHFEAWLGTLTNLDAQDQAESLAHLNIQLDPSLTEEQREVSLSNAYRFAKYLTWASWVAAVWGWFYPRPYSLVILILAAIPPIAIYLGLRAKGVYQFDGNRNDARPSLAVPVIVPGLILALRAVYDLSFLRWQQLLSPIFLVTIVMTALIASSDPKTGKQRWSYLATLFIALGYAGGVTAMADSLLDHSTPQILQAEVLHKRISSGRHTTWYLELAPWGPQDHPDEISVHRSLYNSVQPGQTVCVYLFLGALKIPWFQLAHCANRPSTSQVPPSTVQH